MYFELRFSRLDLGDQKNPIYIRVISEGWMQRSRISSVLMTCQDEPYLTLNALRKGDSWLPRLPVASWGYIKGEPLLAVPLFTNTLSTQLLFTLYNMQRSLATSQILNSSEYINHMAYYPQISSSQCVFALAVESFSDLMPRHKVTPLVYFPTAEVNLSLTSSTHGFLPHANSASLPRVKATSQIFHPSTQAPQTTSLPISTFIFESQELTVSGRPSQARRSSRISSMSAEKAGKWLDIDTDSEHDSEYPADNLENDQRRTSLKWSRQAKSTLHSKARQVWGKTANPRRSSKGFLLGSSGIWNVFRLAFCIWDPDFSEIAICRHSFSILLCLPLSTFDVWLICSTR